MDNNTTLEWSPPQGLMSEEAELTGKVTMDSYNTIS
jgi:hypothetical protein